MLVVDKDTFESEVVQSNIPVVVDIWGPQCAPCLALLPHVEELSTEFAGRVKFCKLNAAENRRLLISLRIMGLPTFLFYKNGERVGLITGNETTLEQIRTNTESLLG